jgi:hypothetical protein
MKNLYAVIAALFLISGSVMAACFGPYCYTDLGAQVPTSTGPQGIKNMTKAEMHASIPSAKGQMIYCSDCTAAICISSGVIVGAYTTPVTATHCD